MSEYENSILAFIEIVKSGDLSPAQWTDLDRFAEEIPTDTEDLYEAIEKWLQPIDRAAIRAKWQEFTQNLDAGLGATGGAIENPTTMGPRGSNLQTTPEQAATDPSLKVRLTNEISLYKARNFLDRSSPSQTPNTK